MTRPLRPSLTTGQVAAHLNAAVCARVYDDRAIRCEVDGGRLRAFVAPRDQRRRIRVTEAALLEWAAGVLRETELHALRVSLGLDPLSDQEAHAS